MASLYGSHRIGDSGYINAQLSYGDHRFTGHRVLGDELNRYRVYQQESDAFTMHIETGRTYRDLDWQPEVFLGAGYRVLHEGAFEEQGGGGISLGVHGRTTESLETEVGVRIRRSFETAFGRYVPRFEVAWVHDFYAGDNVITAHYADVPNYDFAIPVGIRAKNALRVGGAIDLIRDENFSLTASFENDLRRGTDSKSAKLEFRVAM